MKNNLTGFAVLYRWRIRAGMEEDFREAWDAVTSALMRERGALGSRLHRAASAIMKEAVEESFPPILLRPVSDHLVKQGIVDQ